MEIIVCVAIWFYIIWIIGVEINFFPFIGSSEVRAIGFCSLLIVISVFAIIRYYYIKSKEDSK